MPLHSKKPGHQSNIHRYHFPVLPQQDTLSAVEVHYDSPQNVAAKYQALMEEGQAAGFAEGLRQGLEQGQQQGQLAGQERGFKAGLQEGREAGIQQAYGECKPPLEAALQQANQLYQALESALQTTLAAQQEDLCRLIAQTCRQVLRAELALTPAQILPLVEETLALLPKQQGPVSIRMAPATLALLQEQVPDAIASWQMEPDAQLAAGDFSIHTGLATAESSLEERLDLAVDRLRQQLASTAGEGDVADLPPPQPDAVAPAAAAERGLPWGQEDTIADFLVPMDRFSDDDFKA